MSSKEELLLYGAVAIYIVASRKRKRRKIWVKDWLSKRTKYSHINILEELRFHPKDWNNYLRMDEETYLQLYSLVSPLIKKQDTNMRNAITTHERLTAALRYLATGRSLEDLKFTTIISPQALGKIIEETCQAIFKALKKDYCKFPTTENEWKDIGKGFQDRWNFPNCLGAIDGKHVAIIPPPESGSYFFNYKKYFSQVLLAVADSDYKLIYFNFGVNGRISDGGVLQKTELYEKLNNNTLSIPQPTQVNGTLLPFVFVGDEAFELREELVKPFNSNVLTPERRICNYRFSRARRIIENVFGILVSRFQVFQKPINLGLDRISHVVFACCALHNFLRQNSPNKYTMADCFDAECEESGTITLGLRVDPSRKLQRNRSGSKSIKAKRVRDKFLEYFNGNGKVPWQDKYALNL